MQPATQNQPISKVETKPKVYAVEFENVSRQYRLHHEPKLTLQDRVVNLLKRNNSYEEFWALKNVSFKLEQGKTLGVIGKNGAGKSTLLKLATRILEPSSGRIRVNGRVSAMLELGTGFHPDLSARDNIYLNGAFYGFNKKAMDERYDRIVEFSELGKFIDTPVKHFSSGMYMRLGFAVAITVNPDILIIDEVLAVGDAAFGRKCHRAIEDLKRQSKAMLFVSHAAGEIARFCDEVIYLNKGEIVAYGTPGEVLDEYMMDSMGPTYFTSKLVTEDKSNPATPLPKPNPAPAPKTENKPARNGHGPESAAPGKITPATPLSQLSTEEMLLLNQEAATRIDPAHFRLDEGISQTNPCWLFNLPQPRPDEETGNSKVVQPEFYLSVLNPYPYQIKVELYGFKQSTSLLDQAAGALREVPMGNYEIDREQIMLLRLENQALASLRQLKIVAEEPMVAELVEFNTWRNQVVTNSPAASAPALAWFFPFCDIRANNLCRLELTNLNKDPVTVEMTLHRDWSNADRNIRQYEVSACSQLVVDLNQELAAGEGEHYHYPGLKFFGGIYLQGTSPFVARRQSLQLTSPNFHLVEDNSSKSTSPL